MYSRVRAVAAGINGGQVTALLDVDLQARALLVELNGKLNLAPDGDDVGVAGDVAQGRVDAHALFLHLQKDQSIEWFER